MIFPSNNVLKIENVFKNDSQCRHDLEVGGGGGGEGGDVRNNSRGRRERREGEGADQDGRGR